MKKILIFFALALIIFSSINISAWSPEGHTKVSLYVLDNSNSKIIQNCQSKENRDAFLLGSETPDLAVVYYYSSGGANYKLTHNWNFAGEVMKNAVTQDEQCFAYGIAEHLIADSVSHNMFVPDLIKRTHVPNWMIHPLGEQKYGSVLVSEDPTLENKVSHMMDALYGIHGDRYAQMVQKALGTNSGIDAKSEMTKLGYSLNTFFQTQYRPSGTSLIFKMYPIITSITNTIQPIVGKVSHSQADDYFNKAEELSLQSFSNWGSRYQISPHGFDSLSEADKSASYFNILYLAIALLPAIGLLIWRRLKTKKWNWFYLLLIPLTMILEIVVVYIMI